MGAGRLAADRLRYYQGGRPYAGPRNARSFSLSEQIFQGTSFLFWRCWNGGDRG
nr:MAG TPA: hypothetical protein [Caudoviricetes sp.]